ncbi:Vps5 C terminal like-domain-containing protein [Cladochytrium replicatum]|nr:Vps5 C terminal like-domain-containing protein [Cladochytrium replicatum]
MFRFDVRVVDPQKVNEPMSSYVIYKVKTWTNNPSYRLYESSVTRRYNDFLWLNSRLIEKYPGVILPPLPEKQAVGRFDEDFIENRRMGLHKMLRKMTSHHLLQTDEDLRFFLESENFIADVGTKKRESSKGLMDLLGDAMSNATQTLLRMPEVDEFFEGWRNQVDALEQQLKGLSKGIETLVRIRREMAGSMGDMADASAVFAASVESKKPRLSESLGAFADTHRRVQEIRDLQAKQDLTGLQAMIDEQLRIVGSIRIALNGRTKTYQAWQTAEALLARRQDALDKVVSVSKIRTDKISVLQMDVDDATKHVVQSRRDFQRVSELLKEELSKFQTTRLDEVTATVRRFAKEMAESQREVLGILISQVRKC